MIPSLTYVHQFPKLEFDSKVSSLFSSPPSSSISTGMNTTRKKTGIRQKKLGEDYHYHGIIRSIRVSLISAMTISSGPERGLKFLRKPPQVKVIRRSATKIGSH